MQKTKTGPKKLNFEPKLVQFKKISVDECIMDYAGIEKALTLGYKIVENNAAIYKKRRYLFPRFENAVEKRNIVVVSGLRGVGKTVMISQFLSGKKYAYLSMDYPALSQYDLMAILEYVYSTKEIDYIALDEFQFSMEFEALKFFYESHNDVKLIVTGSSALALGLSLLERRVIPLTLKPLSLREYIYFTAGKELSPITFDEILEGKWTHLLPYDSYILPYMRRALPFLLEGGNGYAVIEAILYKDLPVFRKISMKSIKEIERLLIYLAKAKGETSISSASAHLGISKSQLLRYVGLLREAHILVDVPPKGKSLLKERKFYFPPPLREIILDFVGEEAEKGMLLEEFFIHHVFDYHPKYLPGKGRPDFLIKGKSFEVGGRGKSWKQKPDYLVVSGRVPGKGELPLVAFGFLY